PNPARWAQVERVKEANHLIKSYCRWRRHLKFIDVFHAMLGPDGKPRPELFVQDRLHMNPTGYPLDGHRRSLFGQDGPARKITLEYFVVCVILPPWRTSSNVQDGISRTGSSRRRQSTK